MPVASDSKNVREALRCAISGSGAHADTESVFASLNWKLAGKRPANSPHSIYQLLTHMLYWQDWVLEWLDGGDPPTPEHASGSWPGKAGPSSRKEWDQAVQRFRNGLAALTRHTRVADLSAKNGAKSRLEMLQTIASHNSYHAGQAVLIRQQLGAWPPPTGSLTW